MRDEKAKKHRKTIAALQARWGAQAIRPLQSLPRQRPALSTGQPALDRALGGGLPRGAISEWRGRPTAGMTTLAYQVIAAAQTAQLSAYFLDLSHIFDPDYAGRLGVQLTQLLLIRPHRPVQSATILHDLALAPTASLIVADLPPDLWSGQAGRALGQALNALRGPLAQSGGLLLCLTLLPAGSDPDRSYPASAPFAELAALRLDGRHRRWLYHGHDITGVQMEITILKQKNGPAGQTFRLNVTWPVTPDTP